MSEERESKEESEGVYGYNSEDVNLSIPEQDVSFRCDKKYWKRPV